MREIEEKENERPKERSLGIILILLALLVIIPVGFRLYSSYLDKRLAYLEKVAEKARLQKELDQLQAQNNQLKEKEEFLKTRQGVEQVARDKLGLTKPGEIPFIVIQQGQEEEQATQNKGKTRNVQNKDTVKKDKKKT